jgi:carbohydrate-selective porin OprB
MKESIRYMYVRDANQEPVGCVAISVNRSANRAEYAISVRNPVDAFDNNQRRVKFNRMMAQDLAMARLRLKPEIAYIPPNASQHEITASVLGDIIASGSAPARAVRFAKRWLATLFFTAAEY